MHHLIFSISALLGTEIVLKDGVTVGTLKDVICNKDSGRITYLMISADPNTGQSRELYALHHSYFYLNGDDEVLIFDPNTGTDDASFYIDLPDHYDDATVHDFTHFSSVVLPRLTSASHRSDND